MSNKSQFHGLRRLGYCSGIITESLQYNMFYTYYLLFLTDIIKLPPVLASTISLISVLWDAFTDPIIGYYADKGKGKKKSFMAKALFPMLIAFSAAFIPIESSSNTLKFIFYAAITMIFWLAYTFYTIPYYAVVAEITKDYDERTSIRGESSLINVLAIAGGNIIPAVLPALFAGLGFSTKNSWALTAFSVALISFIFGAITVFSLRKVKFIQKTNNSFGSTNSFTDIFKSFGQIIKLKPFATFMIFIVFFLMSSSMLQANIAFMIKDCIGVSYDKYVPIFIIGLVLTMAAVIPIVTKLSEKYDRRSVCIAFFTTAAIGLFSTKIIGLRTIPMLVSQPIFMGIAAGAFWTVFYSMAYDLTEVDEYTSGLRRESIITALPQFFQKFGAAIGMWLSGLALQLSGYDSALSAEGAKQSIKTIKQIENISTIYPAILLVISIIGLILYPVSKERFNALSEALENKKNGLPYTDEGFSKLLNRKNK